MKRVYQRVCMMVAVAMLAGCMAHPDLVKIGQSEQSVLEQLGPSDAAFMTKNQERVLVYSDQPFGQDGWWMYFDAQGNFLRKETIMNPEHWQLVKPGVHTKAQVYQMFGRCAQEYTFKLQNQTAFMYRYKDSGGSNMAWWVQFDENNIVTETASTLDPWERDTDTLFWHF